MLIELRFFTYLLEADCAKVVDKICIYVRAHCVEIAELIRQKREARQKNRINKGKTMDAKNMSNPVLISLVRRLVETSPAQRDSGMSKFRSMSERLDESMGKTKTKTVLLNGTQETPFWGWGNKEL